MTKQTVYQQVETYIIENREAHYRLAYSYVKNKEDALDVLQEAIVKALQSAGRLQDARYLKTWYYRILINTSIDFLRKNGRMIAAGEEVVQHHLPETVQHGRDLDLAAAVEQLPAEERILIILRYFEDMKISEIAQVLEEKLSTTKARLYRVLKKLRLEIGEESNL